MTPDPIVVGASATGASHARAGLPCQDAFAFARGENGSVRVAVADGLGSARLAHVGAMRAVEAAVAAPAEGDLEVAARAMAQAARAAVEALAAGDETPLGDFACTLIAIEWDAEGLAVAHVGDGAVVASLDDELVLLSGPDRSEYVNEVEPLTSDGWEERLRVASLAKPVAALAAFTDGCERAALRADGSPHAGFFDPLFAHAGSVEEERARADLQSLLSGAKIGEHSDDDKTLVLAMRRAR